MPNTHGSDFVVIDAFEYADACTAWYQHHGRHDDPGKNFMEYLGIHHYSAVNDGFVMPSHAAHKLRLLLSPYAQTIIKMYYARQEPL